MKTTRVILFVAVAALAAAGSAAAKWPGGLAPVCGPSSCARVPEALVLSGGPASGGPLLVSPPPLQPYYVVGGSGPRSYVVAATGAVRSGFNWARLEPGSRSALVGLAHVAPFPAPRVLTVVLAGRPVDPAAAYASIFEPLPPGPVPEPGSRAVSIVLRSAVPSPWTNGNTNVSYYPSARMLHRQGEWVRAPERLVAQMERDLEPAGGASFGTGGDPPWGALAGGLGAAWLVLGGAWLARRRRPRERTS